MEKQPSWSDKELKSLFEQVPIPQSQTKGRIMSQILTPEGKQKKVNLRFSIALVTCLFLLISIGYGATTDFFSEVIPLLREIQEGEALLLWEEETDENGYGIVAKPIVYRDLSKIQGIVGLNSWINLDALKGYEFDYGRISYIPSDVRLSGDEEGNMNQEGTIKYMVKEGDKVSYYDLVYNNGKDMLAITIIQKSEIMRLNLSGNEHIVIPFKADENMVDSVVKDPKDSIVYLNEIDMDKTMIQTSELLEIITLDDKNGLYFREGEGTKYNIQEKKGQYDFIEGKGCQNLIWQDSSSGKIIRIRTNPKNSMSKEEMIELGKMIKINTDMK